MKHGVVVSVDSISPVHIRADGKPFLTRGEAVRLVRGRVRAQNRVVVDVVRIRLSAARVVGRKPEGVEVLVHRYNRS